MANRWERGKLGPYTLPADFTTGGIAIGGINNVSPKVEEMLLPEATVFYSSLSTLVDDDSYIIPSGQAISRTDFSSLFGTIGTNFGVGDGSSTFNLPQLRGLEARAEGTAAASGAYELQPSCMGDHTHTQPACPGATSPSPSSYSMNLGPAANVWGTYESTVVGTTALRTTYPHFTGTDNVGNSPQYKGEGGARPANEYMLWPYYTAKPTTLPIGAVVPFIGSDDLTAMGSSYLLCNGDSIDPATYPNAASAGFTTTPDLRGMFVAGVGMYATTPGSKTPSNEVSRHSHLMTSPFPACNIWVAPPLPSGNYDIAFVPGGGGSSASGPNFPKEFGSSAGMGPANESRPVNMAVNYFMRVA